MKYYLLCLFCAWGGGCASAPAQTAAPAKYTVTQMDETTWITSDGVVFRRFAPTDCKDVFDCLSFYTSDDIEIISTYEITLPSHLPH